MPSFGVIGVRDSKARLVFAQNLRRSSKRSMHMLNVFLARCIPSIRYGLRYNGGSFIGDKTVDNLKVPTLFYQ